MVNAILISALLIIFAGLGSATTFGLAAWISHLKSTNSKLLSAFKHKPKPDSYNQLLELSQGLDMSEKELLLEFLFETPIRIHKSQCKGEAQLDLICRSDVSYEEANLIADANKTSEYIG